MAKKTTTKIIEDELKVLGELATEEARATVRVSKDTYTEDGKQINEGGSLRDSIIPYPKGKKLTMSQLNYGKWQKPKELGSTPWHPPQNPTSELWDNPMATAIAKHIPETVNVISKSLIKNILDNAGIKNKIK